MFVALLWLSILVLVGVLSLLICRCLPCLWGCCLGVASPMLIDVLLWCSCVVALLVLGCCCDFVELFFVVLLLLVLVL